MSNLTIVLPAYNEEASLGSVIDEIRALPMECDILVVDGNSQDDTYNVAVHKDVKVVTEPLRGKGQAIRKGFGLVSTPYIIMMDSDGTYPAEYIPETLHSLEMGNEVVIGHRRWKSKGSMSLINSLGNKFLSILASTLYGTKVKDVCSGLWGFRKDTLDKFHLSSNGFTLEAELFTKVVKHECQLDQIPIVYRPRFGGSNSKLRLSDGFRITWFLVKNRWKK